MNNADLKRLDINEATCRLVFKSGDVSLHSKTKTRKPQPNYTTIMKPLKLNTAALLGTLAARIERLTHIGTRVTRPSDVIALANELAAINDHGIETQQIDPASTNLPVGSRYLLYTRGATGSGYADICGVSTLPLGPSSDSPNATGDFLNIRRLGARPGLEIGIPATGFAVDDLVLTAANGKVQTFNAAANGTYWVVGRAAKTTTANATEIAYIPTTPYKITVTGGVATVVVA